MTHASETDTSSDSKYGDCAEEVDRNNSHWKADTPRSNKESQGRRVPSKGFIQRTKKKLFSSNEDLTTTTGSAYLNLTFAPSIPASSTKTRDRLFASSENLSSTLVTTDSDDYLTDAASSETFLAPIPQTKIRKIGIFNRVKHRLLGTNEDLSEESTSGMSSDVSSKLGAADSSVVEDRNSGFASDEESDSPIGFGCGMQIKKGPDENRPGKHQEFYIPRRNIAGTSILDNDELLRQQLSIDPSKYKKFIKKQPKSGTARKTSHGRKYYIDKVKNLGTIGENPDEEQ